MTILSKYNISNILTLILMSVCLACSKTSVDNKSAKEVDSLITIADSLFGISEIDESLSTLTKAYQQATTDLQRACIQVDMAHIHYFIGHVDVATNMLEHSLLVFEEHSNQLSSEKKYQLEALIVYADILQSVGKEKKSVYYYTKASEIANEINDQQSYIISALPIVRYWASVGKFWDAIDLSREILSHCSNNINGEMDRFSVLCEIHGLFVLLGDYSEATIFLDKMRSMSHDNTMQFVVDMSELYQLIYDPFTDMEKLSESAARLKADIAETGMTECYNMNALGLLAEYYMKKGDYNAARMSINSFLNVAKNDKINISNAFFRLTEADLLIHYNKLDSAYAILMNKELIDICTNVVRLKPTYNNVMSKYYFKKKDYPKEYERVLRMANLSDSIQVELIHHNLAYRNMVHQRDTTILSNAIKLNQKQQKIESYAFWQVVWIIVIIVVFLIAIIIALNVVLEMLKEREREIYQQNLQLQHEVVRHTSILQTQKLELERTNERLNREIRYAGRLQRDMLSSESVLNCKMLRGHFVYYKPCQNISGDFYWFYSIGDKQYILCADATGHGVPGAFVSMVCSTLLNDLVSTSELSAAELIRMLDIKLRTILRSNSNAHGNDSVDASLVCINNRTNTITMSLARHKARIVRANGNLEYIHGVKRSIGDIDEAFLARPFIETEYKFVAGDMLYLTSDGLESQFGGIDGRKLKSHRMDEMFLLMSQQKIELQRTYLNKFFNNWKGEYEQTDDVLVIGLAF